MMQIKTLPISGLKAGPDDGLKEREFIVYPSTFTRTPDAYGDVIAKGAFVNTIKDWKNSGDVLPGMYLHDPNQIVAGASEMSEDSHGWRIRGFFDEDDLSERIYRWVKGRRITELSFAFDVIDQAGVELENGVKANELRELKVWEFSFLPKGFAANNDTSVVAVKAATDRIAAAVRRGLPVDINSLRKSQETLAALIAAVGGADGSANGKPVNDDEGSDGVKSDVCHMNPPVDDLALLDVLDAELALNI